LVQGDFNGSGAGFIVDFTSASGSGNLGVSGGQAVLVGGTGNVPFYERDGPTGEWRDLYQVDSEY
jgi:hypothetical protein